MRFELKDLARGVGRGLGVLAYQGVDAVEHLADLGFGGADEGVLISQGSLEVGLVHGQAVIGGEALD